MFRPLVNNKIAQVLVFLADNISEPLYLTKALKLLYILDETAIRETGVPITWLDYQVWKLGPVARDVYEEFRYDKKTSYKGEEVDFADELKVEVIPNPVEDEKLSYVIKSNTGFDIDEFSDYELELLQRIVRDYGNLSGSKLIDKLHEEGTLWDKVVKSQKLQRLFELHHNRSSHLIDFTELVQDNDMKEMAYKAAFENMAFSGGIKITLITELLIRHYERPITASKYFTDKRL